ncbi:hypothetical protein D3C72_2232020 [compost metagenome]
MASSAWESVKGPEPVETKASMACTSASMPVQAERNGSMLRVVSGSISETSGTAPLLTMENFIRAS